MLCLGRVVVMIGRLCLILLVMNMVCVLDVLIIDVIMGV